jgi:hypothetical protein
MDGTKIQMKVRRMTLDLRAINRLVQGEIFLHLWGKANDSQRRSADKLIKEINLAGLREWVREARTRDLRDMTYRVLVAHCQRAKVPNYSRMQKDEMINALSELQNDRTST